MSSSFATSQPAHLNDTGLDVRLAVLRGAAGLLLLITLLIAWRRVVGALAVPLPAASLFAVGLALAAVVRLIRIVSQRDTPHQNAVLPWLAVGAAVFTAAALSVPGTPLVGLALLWAPLAVEEILYFRGARTPLTGLAPNDRTGQALRNSLSTETQVEIAPHVDTAGRHVWHVQQRALADGKVDQLSGWIELSFEAGQRTQVAHLAFCPPFVQSPQLSLEIASDHDASAQHTQLLPFGARLEVKLRQDAAEPTQVRVQFVARSTVADELFDPEACK